MIKKKRIWLLPLIYCVGFPLSTQKRTGVIVEAKIFFLI